MIQAKQDYMIVRKQERASPLIVPDSAKAPSNLAAFEILSIGPGRYENGVFIKTTHKPGDKVFINGQILNTKWEDQPILFARERDIAAELVEGDINV